MVTFLIGNQMALTIPFSKLKLEYHIFPFDDRKITSPVVQ